VGDAALIDVFVPQEFRNFLTGAADLTNLSEIFTKTYLSLDEKLKSYEYEGTTATTAFIWESKGL
jgi:hypothetical protein